MSIFSELKGVTSAVTAPGGAVESCMLDAPNEIPTACGVLVPKWDGEDVRRKHIPAVTFYPDGAVKSVALNDQTDVETPLGVYPAELVTFYPDGALRRSFPVNGRLSGYWSQQDEAALCPALKLKLPQGAFTAKLIDLHFYPSGALRSVGLWPGESVVLRTNVGMISARCGFSLYENGDLQSVEPPSPLPVETPVGVLTAFDVDALGVQGDQNSLSFDPNGGFCSLTTSSDTVEVILPDHTAVSYAPGRRPDPLLDDRTIVTPLRLTFTPDSVSLDNGTQRGTYPLAGCCFRTLTGQGRSTESLRQSPMTCGDCSKCGLCP